MPSGPPGCPGSSLAKTRPEPTLRPPDGSTSKRPDVIAGRCRRRRASARRARSARPLGFSKSSARRRGPVRPSQVERVDALEVQARSSGVDAVGGVGEVDEAVGPADDVVGAVRAACPTRSRPRSRRPMPSGSIRETRRPFCSQKTIRPSAAKVWPLAAPVCSRTTCDRAVRARAGRSARP